MDVETKTTADLIFRCSACGYQTWAETAPAACPLCRGGEFSGATPIEWRRRLHGSAAIVAEPGAAS